MPVLAKPIPPELITPAYLARLFARCRVVGECWFWTGSRTKAGYGFVTVTHQGKMGHYYVTRLVYTACHGPLAPGRFACHHCDHPSCIRPTHLFSGTAADNNADARRKGRTGVAVPKLSPAQVQAVREQYRTGQASQVALAALFGVSGRTIHRALYKTPYAKEYAHVH